MLLVIAITVHNFPEGLAVGVAFGGQNPAFEGTMEHIHAEEEAEASSSCAYSTFAQARTVAIGIGLQNFPEGLAVR